MKKDRKNDLYMVISNNDRYVGIIDGDNLSTPLLYSASKNPDIVLSLLSLMIIDHKKS